MKRRNFIKSLFLPVFAPLLALLGCKKKAEVEPNETDWPNGETWRPEGGIEISTWKDLERAMPMEYELVLYDGRMYRIEKGETVYHNKSGRYVLRESRVTHKPMKLYLGV